MEEVVIKNDLLVEIEVCAFCDTPDGKSIKQQILGIIESFPSRLIEVRDEENSIHT